MYPNTNEIVYADRIYIDTSSMMGIAALKQFIENYGDVLRTNRKTLVVSSTVVQELVRHLDSDEKRNLARQALDLIRANPDIFQMENTKFSYEDVQKAFADESLYKILLSQRNICRQLLITNDRCLSRDAFRLNQIESWSGRTVAVCYIDKLGRLEASDVVKQEYSASSFDSVGIAAASDAEKNATKEEMTPANDEGNTRLKYLLGGVIAAGLFTAGLFTGRYKAR
ncbi:MAG TPA: hypothetical protein DCQ39_01080 [Lachnospiraceae bacterium]|nr:hypothetical protein [Lachnospiraceae bacterium]